MKKGQNSGQGLGGGSLEPRKEKEKGLKRALYSTVAFETLIVRMADFHLQANSG